MNFVCAIAILVQLNINKTATADDGNKNFQLLSHYKWYFVPECGTKTIRTS